MLDSLTVSIIYNKFLSLYYNTRYFRWSNDLTPSIVNQNDGNDGHVPYGGCTIADGYPSTHQMILRFNDAYTKLGCIALPFYKTNCEQATFGAQAEDSVWGDKLCGLNRNCVADTCVAKTEAGVTYIDSVDGLHSYFIPADVAQYDAAIVEYLADQHAATSKYGIESSWDLAQLTTSAFMKFHNVYLDNGLFTLLEDTVDTSVIEFVPQLFVRSSDNGKEFLEVTYYGQCVDESLQEQTDYFDYCRLDKDGSAQDPNDLDQTSNHEILYGETINNVPIKYSIENSNSPYQRILYANTNDVQEHVCNSIKALDIDLNSADTTLEFTVTESLHLRNCQQNNEGVFPYSCYEEIQGRLCGSISTTSDHWGRLIHNDLVCTDADISSSITTYSGCVSACKSESSCAFIEYDGSTCTLKADCGGTTAASGNIYIYTIINKVINKINLKIIINFKKRYTSI